MYSEVVAHFDEQRGRTYYHNKRTGQTGWSLEEVSDAPAAQPSRRLSIEPTVAPEMSNPMRGGAGASPRAGPPMNSPPKRRSSVKALFDKTSGQQYFYNEDTGKTGWSPQEVDDNPAGSNFADIKGGGRENIMNTIEARHTSPAGRPTITEHYDAQRGTNYYVDESTGKTAWSKEELMRMASDTGHGKLCAVNLYDGRAGAGAAKGALRAQRAVHP